MDSARSSIDCQCLFWGTDISGLYLLDRILRAADRGVRVRVLVDDAMQKGKDRHIAAATAHPNIEVRVFNPVSLRGTMETKLVGVLVGGPSKNRRMHNKVFTADNALSLIGGRNNADQYFGLNHVYNFRDLDVLVSGPVIDGVSRGFDHYWNSSQAIPAERLVEEVTEADLHKLRVISRAERY